MSHLAGVGSPTLGERDALVDPLCTALVRQQIDDDEHEGRDAQQPRHNVFTHDSLQISFAGGS